MTQFRSLRISMVVLRTRKRMAVLFCATDLIMGKGQKAGLLSPYQRSL